MKKQSLISRSKSVSILTKTGFFLLLGLFILFSSCKKKKADPECSPLTGGGFEVVSHTERDAQDVVEQFMVLPDDSGSFDYNDLYKEMYEELAAEPDGALGLKLIAHEAVKYASTDNNGDPVMLTGLLIYPWNLRPFGKVNAPIISMNHGTQILKKYAPSKWKKAQWSDWKNFPEMAVADVMALWYGWIIIMPDYQGMGDDIGENHPYVIRDRLATATADMVEAAQQSLSCDRNAYVKWNGQTYLYGYSEGGFVTMVAARELEARKVSLNGVVCMDGPYDLSGTMLDVMLGDKPFPVPYFLPMMLVGYNTMYPTSFNYTTMLKEPYRTDIPKYTTGLNDETVVNGIMPADKILKKVFTDSFADSLKTFTSRAYQFVYENNSYVNWAPKSKMLLWHCKNDDCVPFGNYVVAKKRFSDMGLTNIEYVEYGPIDNPKSGTIHVAVAPKAFLEGAKWIRRQTKL